MSSHSSTESQVIVFASQKGGSGKTTLSGHIAVEAEMAGAGPVALIDTDPQGSLAKWWNVRATQTPVFAHAAAARLREDIKSLRAAGYKLIVIDTPPAVTTSITDVIAHADLVVIPTRPSPHDLRAVGLTVDIVEHQNKSLIFVINAATARARITSDTAVSLSQHGTVAPITLHNRVDYAASMIDGRTVGEISPNSRSAEEVSTLWKYLADRLRRQKRGSDDAGLAQLTPSFEVELLTPAPVQSGVVPAPAPPRDEAPPSPSAAKVDDGAHAVLRAAATAQYADGALLLDELADRRGAPPSPGASKQKQDPRRWHGVERRGVNLGPPPGMTERRQTFGKRNT